MNPNSGMDWLERGLGIASVIPGVGSVTAAAAWKINQKLYMRRMERLQAGAADLLKNPSLLPETVSAAMYYDLREGVEYDPEQPIGDMTAEQYAAKKQRMELNATLREGIEEGERILVADDVYELADIMLKGNIGGSSHLADVDTVAAYMRELGQVVRQALPEVFDADPSLSESQKTLKAAQVSLYTYKQVADAGILYFADMQKTTEQGADAAVTHPTNLMKGYHGSEFAINLVNRGARMAAFELHRIAGVTRALAHANIGPDLAATPQVRLGAVIVPREGSTHGTGSRAIRPRPGRMPGWCCSGTNCCPMCDSWTSTGFSWTRERSRTGSGKWSISRSRAIWRATSCASCSWPMSSPVPGWRDLGTGTGGRTLRQGRFRRRRASPCARWQRCWQCCPLARGGLRQPRGGDPWRIPVRQAGHASGFAGVSASVP